MIRTLVSFFSLVLFFRLPVFRGSVLSNLQGCFDLLSSFFEFVLRPFSLSESVDFSFSKGSFFFFLSVFFSWVFFYRAFLLSGCGLSSFPYIGLLCLLRMYTINSCVGDT